MPHLEPTYLRYIYDGLVKGSIHPENAAELPEGLIGLYEEAFDERISVVERQKLLERFAIWALLKKEVSAAFVAEVLGETEDDIQEFISTYSAWFNSPESGKYQLYHERLKVYLLQKLSEGEIHELHEKIISRLERAIKEQKADEFEWYGLEFLDVHFSVSAIIKGDLRLFKLGRNSDFEKRQVEISEGFEWPKSLYKKCIETATIYEKDNVIEWGVKLHLINQKEQKDWTLIQRHFDAGDIDRFDSELEEKRYQFSLVSDNYLSYPTLLIYAFYFRLIENQFIIRSNQEKLFLQLNKIIEKHEKEKYEESIYLFDFPRLHLVIIERFYSFGFDVSFLIKRFNFQMSRDDAQKCLFPSDFLSNGVYDNLYTLLKEFAINEGDFFESFIALGFKYSTKNIEEIIERNGLLNIDKSILKHRIQEDLNPAYLIDVITKTLELVFDSFFSKNQKNLYDLIEFALVNKTYFKTKKWEQFALTYMRKLDGFDYRAINLLNLIKKIPDRDLIKIGLKAIKTNQDSLVSVFFGYLVKHNKVGLIKSIIDITPDHSTNLTLWNFLLENKFNLEFLFESSIIESKELKRIWIVNTIRYIKSEIATKSFLQFCQYSESSIVEIDQPEMNLDFWLPESLLTDDFKNNIGGLALTSRDNRFNTDNNLLFVLLLTAQSDVLDPEVEKYLKPRIKELFKKEITRLHVETVKILLPFFVKHSSSIYDFYFDTILDYLYRLHIDTRLNLIYNSMEREDYKYLATRLIDFVFKQLNNSPIPTHPEQYGDLSKLKLNDLELIQIYDSYIRHCFESNNSYEIGNMIYFSSIDEHNKNKVLLRSFLDFYCHNPELFLCSFSFNEFALSDHLQSLNIIDENASELIFKKIINYPGYPSFDQCDKKILLNLWFNTTNLLKPNLCFDFLFFEFLNSGLKNDDYCKFFVIQSFSNENSQTIALASIMKSSHEIEKYLLKKIISISICNEINVFDQIIKLFGKCNNSKKLKYFNQLGETTKNRIEFAIRQKSINYEISIIEDKLITNSYEYVKYTKSKSAAEEADFEKSIEDLAESENIVLLLYCSLLIQISDKKHLKRVELIKKVVSELVKAGFSDFSSAFDEYTEYEEDLIFLTYTLVNSYKPTLKTDNKLLIYLPLRIKFIFIFSELLKKEKAISLRTKKSAIGYIDYCLNKKLSISDLTRLYDSSMAIGSQTRANKIIKKILLQIEPDEHLYIDIHGILRSCLSFKDSKNISLLINSKNDLIQFSMENLIEARIMLGIFEFDDYNIVKSELDIDAKINILSKLVIKSDLITLKSNVLHEIDLYRDECHENDAEIFEDYLVEIGCQLYQRFGLKYSKDYVLARSYSSVSTITYFISELIIKNEIKEVDIFIRKARLKCEIDAGELMSKLIQMEMFQLGKMENTILAFYSKNSKECLEMIFSTRGNDLQTPLILSKLKYRKNECHILIDNVEKLNFTIDAWINIIKQQPFELKYDLVAKIISNKKSQITSNELNLLQDSLSILISKKSIDEVISNYSDFKQWNRIERILRWLKKEDRLEEIQNLLELSFDNNWDIRLAVFVRLVGKDKTLKVLSGKTNFINGQAIESIDKLSEIPRIVAHVHPEYFELIRHSLDGDSINLILESLKSRTTEAGYSNSDSFSNLYWTRMNIAEINRYISIYYNNREALELLVGNFKILSELEGEKEHIELLSQFDVNYAKYDVEL